MADPQRITESEIEILSVLLRKGPVTGREVHAELAKSRDVGYTKVLKLMQRSAGKCNWLAGVLGMAIAGFLLVGAGVERPVKAATAVPEPVQDEAQTDEPAGKKANEKVRVSVVGPDKLPLKGASLRLGVWYQETANTATYKTDEHGVAEIPLPEGLKIFRLWADAEDCAGLVAAWEEDEIKVGKLPPSEFTFQMVPAVEIGGVFVDEDDQPIPGVAVEIRGSGHSLGEKIRFNSSLADGRGAVVSDVEGRWTLANVPPGDDVKLSLRISHPDYLSDEQWGEIQSSYTFGLKEFRDQSARIVLRKGNKVRGKITDENGDPVSDALIVWGDGPYNQPGSQEMSVKADGSYETPTQKNGELRITVIAPGYAPESTVVDVGPEMEPADFVLSPGKRLEIRFVDEEGKPASDIYVGIDRWRNSASLYNQIHSNVRSTRIPNECDENGIYIWDWAPHDAVRFNFRSRRYLRQSRVSVTASDEPITVVMKRPKMITGRVRDADGQPINSFVVIPRFHGANENESVTSERTDLVQGKDGEFAITMDGQEGKYSLKIEALGYESTCTEIFLRDAAVGPFEVKMKSAPARKYQVLTETGQPVPDATVTVAPVDQILSWESYLDTSRNPHAQTVITDNDGGFALPSSPVARTLMVAAQDGYAEVGDHPDALASKITIQKWASLKGYITRDGKPWAATGMLHTLRYFDGKSYHVQVFQMLKSGGDGRFEYRRFPAMPASLSLRSPESSQGTRVELAFSPEPGREHTVDFSNCTRLKAKFKWTGANAERVDLTKSRFSLTRLEPSVEYPSELLQELKTNGLEKRDAEHIRKWFADRESWDAEEIVRCCFDEYSGQVSETGEFTADVLRPGKYKLRALPVAKSDGMLGSSLSDFSQVVEVGEKPVDLGEVIVPLFEDPQPGSVVGDFEFAVLTGKSKSSPSSKSSLASYKGQYVLLDFWAPYCDVCEKETPRVQRLVKMLGAKGKTTVISLKSNGGGLTERFPATISPNLDWINGQVSVADQEPIHKRLGVWTTQHFVLIDPDGNYVVGGSLVTVVKRMEELGLK